MEYTIETIIPICQNLHTKGKTIVLATGFFDLLHEEHIAFLQKAKSHGDILIVAVESDGRAMKLKGEGRPVESQVTRCQKVAKYADYVIALDDSFDNFEAYESLMKSVSPVVYAVSSHTNYQENKAFLTEKYGGKLVVVHDWNPHVSTTKILQTKNKL